MKNDLNSIITYITERYPFSEDKFPATKDCSEEETFRFALNHLALHHAKTAGKIAASSEDIDYGGTGELAELKSNVAKSLVNTLRLAALLSISEEELLEAISRIVGGTSNK